MIRFGGGIAAASPPSPAQGGPGNARLPGALLAQAALSAGAATLPALLGATFGRVPVGFTASFGAYLIAVTHPALPAHGGVRRVAASVVMFSVGAAAGAASGMRTWAFLPLAVACAAWQGWTEVAGAGLRLPAAMSVLALLLSCGNAGTGTSVIGYAAAFFAGAAWQGMVQCMSARIGEPTVATLASDVAALLSRRAEARRFIGAMAALGLVGEPSRHRFPCRTRPGC